MQCMWSLQHTQVQIAQRAMPATSNRFFVASLGKLKAGELPSEKLKWLIPHNSVMRPPSVTSDEIVCAAVDERAGSSAHNQRPRNFFDEAEVGIDFEED